MIKLQKEMDDSSDEFVVPSPIIPAQVYIVVESYGDGYSILEVFANMNSAGEYVKNRIRHSPDDWSYEVGSRNTWTSNYGRLIIFEEIVKD